MKKPTTNSVDLSKKTTASGNQPTDIFKDLSDTSKVLNQVGSKRPNVSL